MEWNHFDENGNAVMVDVSEKEITERIAVASGKIRVNDAVMSAIWEVIAAQMTVGLCLFPTSFCIIRTGRTPPCSEPTTGLKSA